MSTMKKCPQMLRSDYMELLIVNSKEKLGGGGGGMWTNANKDFAFSNRLSIVTSSISLSK